MATMKIKDAEKAALQDELKFYTNLIENHQKETQTMKSVSAKASLPVLSGTVIKTERISTQSLLTIPTNHISSNKSTDCPNLALTNTMHKGSNRCYTTFHKHRVLQNQFKRYPYTYDFGKSDKYVKFQTFNKPVNNIKTSLQHNTFSKKDNRDSTNHFNPIPKYNTSVLASQKLINKNKYVKFQTFSKPVNDIKTSVQHNPYSEKDDLYSQKHFNPISKYNPSVLASQKLDKEMKLVIEQLKQKSKNILPSKKPDCRMISLPTKNQLNFQSSTKVSIQHKHDIYKKTSSFQKISNVKVLHENAKKFINNETNIFKSVSVSSKLSTNFNLPLNGNVKRSPKINWADSSNNLCVKPQPLLENKMESVDDLSKPVHTTSLNSVCSVKKSPKFPQVNSCLKTPVKVRLLKKHSNSIKKVGAKTKLLSSKYKVINKKSPCVQIATCGKPILKSLKNTSKFNKLNDSKRWTNAKLKANTSKDIAETSKSKYKIVNEVNKSEILPKSSINKNIARLSVTSSCSNACTILSCNRNNTLIRKVFSPTKPNYRGINKNISRSKFKSSPRFKLKKSAINHTPRKIHSQSSNSKYKVVNKSSSSVNKISKEAVIHSNKLSDLHNSSMDIDLLIELAAEKNKFVNNDLFSPGKHILTKRIYKSKNTIVNRTAHSAQDKAVKMIKSKYNIINKHLWQRQITPKKFVSGRFYNGNRLNASFQRKMLTSHFNRKNKSNFSKSKIGVRNPSSYFIKRNCRRYLMSRNKYAFGSFRSPNSYKRNTTYQKVFFKTDTRSKLTVPISKTLASRVLHRSINRVLTASKKASKCNQYCMFYNRFGRCNKGVKCSFVHDPKKIAVCTRFLRGTCKMKNCPFSHEICPGKMAICSFFLLGSCTKIDCPYRHETLSPNAKLCKAFVQGYCPGGRKCKQAHILVCPQFIQGNCKKGDACAFPHPPSKERKNVSKTIEQNENTKASEKNENPKEIEEVLMEKMSRYFEPLCEQMNVDKSSINSLVAPRISCLPEQPAFIAFSLSDSET